MSHYPQPIAEYSTLREILQMVQQQIDALERQRAYLMTMLLDSDDNGNADRLKVGDYRGHLSQNDRASEAVIISQGVFQRQGIRNASVGLVKNDQQSIGLGRIDSIVTKYDTSQTMNNGLNNMGQPTNETSYEPQTKYRTKQLNISRKKSEFSDDIYEESEDDIGINPKRDL